MPQDIVHHATQLVPTIPPKEKEERNARCTVVHDAVDDEDPAAIVVR